MGWQRVIDKYLERHAEPVSRHGLSFPFGSYDAAVVVPVYSEDVEALQRLTHGTDDRKRALLILVVNAPTHAPAEAIARNEEFVDFVRASGHSETLASALTWVSEPLGMTGCDVLIVDATVGPYRLKDKEGVGRARRMGLDLALALYKSGRLRSPCCGSTDADVWLPGGYFSALSEGFDSPSGATSERSGVLFPYRHRPAEDPIVRAAMTELEISFRYYVLGLDYAGSPYAYHSLGSALGVSLPHYAGVRGVPNRQAGEDFHLLAKLCKLAPLERLAAPIVEIQSRVSDRVPFGTGPSLQRAVCESGHEIRYYHPEAFECLRLVLDALVRGACDPAITELDLPTSLPPWAVARGQQVWAQVKPLLASCPDEAHRLRRLHERFDALRTLQFIHEAHKNGLERVLPHHAFTQAPFLPRTLDPEGQLRHCVQKEQSLTRPAGLSPT